MDMGCGGIVCDARRWRGDGTKAVVAGSTDNHHHRRMLMVDLSQIREHAEVIGADGVHVGTVDKVEGDRIKLTKRDSGADVEGATGSHAGHHHFISTGLVASVDDGVVRLSANASVAVTFEEEEQA
jgi:hypothetical protein